MSKSPPKYRGQRISHAELVNESRECLREAGVGNHERAMFITEMSRAVVEERNPILYQIQPKVRFRDSKGWKKAYDLVFAFIVENNLQLTLETVGIEMGESVQQKSQKLVDEPGIDFNLILNANRAVNTFNQRVKRYAELNSDSETITEAVSPTQTNKGIQNTPDRKKQPRQSPTASPNEREAKKETKTKRVKRVKSKRKAANSPPNDGINLRNQKNKNVYVTPESGMFLQKLPPMEPMDPSFEGSIDKSNYPKPLSPSRRQGAFTNADKQKPVKVSGKEYVLNSLQSKPSDYDVTSQSDLELSGQDMNSFSTTED